ncbi:hypothetical protein [Clostridioides difficile]|uniref:hypothetical protein n=1 Tax=Clostridioides difficile TaxID=1496 RepID=UPI0022389B14
MSSITKHKEEKSSPLLTKLTSVFRDQGSAAVGLVIIFIIMSVASSNFLTLDNLINVGRQISINAIRSRYDICNNYRRNRFKCRSSNCFSRYILGYNSSEL